MYGNVISCDCHSMPCSFVIIGSGNSLNIAVKCQSTNAMRFCCNCSHKHIPSTPLRGQPRSPSIPHAAASSARVMQTRPHPRAAALSASFRDEVLSAPPRPVALSGAGTRTPPAAAEAAARLDTRRAVAGDAGDAPTSTQAGASSARTRTLLCRGRAAAAFSSAADAAATSCTAWRRCPHPSKPGPGSPPLPLPGPGPPPLPPPRPVPALPAPPAPPRPAPSSAPHLRAGPIAPPPAPAARAPSAVLPGHLHNAPPSRRRHQACPPPLPFLPSPAGLPSQPPRLAAAAARPPSPAAPPDSGHSSPAHSLPRRTR